MKTFTINNVQVTEEQVKQLIKDNPDLLKEEEKKTKFFSPKFGGEYYSLEASTTTHTDNDSNIDISIIARGVYRTYEEVELADEKRKALVRLWNAADKDYYFRPDWDDNLQGKYELAYQYTINRWSCTSCVTLRNNFLLPIFKSEKDCEKFISENLADLEIIRKEI